MEANTTLIDALLEVQTLDRVPRSGWMLRGVADPESVTEHNWHVVFLVWALAPRVGDLDVQRAMALALIHDLAEVRLGDLPRTASRYLSRPVKHAAEGAALEELLAPLGDTPSSLYAEYRAQETPESRFVTACDKLALLLKVFQYEAWGTGALSEFWRNSENFPDASFAPVRQLCDDLLARRQARQSPIDSRSLSQG